MSSKKRPAVESGGDPPPLLDGAEVCRRLRISKSLLRRLVLNGDLPSVLIGVRARRYRTEDVEALAAGPTVKKR